MNIQELTALCTRLLREHWNPIHADVPPDEYEAYAPEVARHVSERTDKAAAAHVASYLASVRTRRMGLPDAPEVDAEAAERIVSIAARAWRAPRCNWCGCSCASPEGHNYIGETLRVRGGYDSTPGNGHGALDDGDEYSFTLCEFCLDHLFTQFRQPPTVVPPIAFRPAAVRVRDDAWRGGKDAFYAEQDRRAMAREGRT